MAGDSSDSHLLQEHISPARVCAKQLTASLLHPTSVRNRLSQRSRTLRAELPEYRMDVEEPAWDHGGGEDSWGLCV